VFDGRLLSARCNLFKDEIRTQYPRGGRYVSGVVATAPRTQQRSIETTTNMRRGKRSSCVHPQGGKACAYIYICVCVCEIVLNVKWRSS